MTLFRRSRRRPPVKASQWVAMRDGTRIAIDVMRPGDADEEARLPAVLVMTCYWRSFQFRFLDPPNRAFVGPRAFWADDLLKRGHAVVVVDARGTGASEGIYLRPWSADEIADYREVVDWVVAQPWSNGRVGAMGHSYEGTTAMLLAASGHSAVRAIVAREFEFDLFADITQPGGVFNETFFRGWSAFKEALDANRVPRLFGWLGRLAIKGVRPVDEDPGGRQLAAIAASRANPDVYEAVAGISARNDPYDAQDITVDDMSIHSHLPGLHSGGVPAQIWASWMDGSTADSALRLFAELPSVQEVWIGAWNHDGEKHASPFAEGGLPMPRRQEQWDAWLRFLEGPLHLGEAPSGERTIHYFTMGEERWKATSQWPPPGLRTKCLYLGPDGALQDELPGTAGSDTWRVNPEATTGVKNRWHTQLAGCPVRYGNRAAADRLLATWTGPPLPEAIEITGHPEVDLFVRSTHRDGAFFAYLEAVDPKGRVRYLTEGILRGCHRGDGGGPPTFRREDMRPMVPGERTRLRIRLLPTSVRLQANWRIRLALAGADTDTFAAIPENEAPEITVERGPESPSALVLSLVKEPVEISGLSC